MIDVHHHCLHGVDDGPRELAEAVELLAMAASEGIDTIIATPHVLRGRWRTPPREELEAKIEQLRSATNDTPHLILGSEYFFAHDVTEMLRDGVIVPLASSRYVLMELASNSVPPMIEQPLYRMQLDGWVPVIAHPERNLVFQEQPERLAFLIEHGARTQITTGSLTGEFGPQARASAETLLRRGLVHFVATDAHNTTKRPPRLRAALEALQSLVGETVAHALTVENPRAVLENRGLDYEPEPVAAAPSDGFLTRVRAFFRSR